MALQQEALKTAAVIGCTVLVRLACGAIPSCAVAPLVALGGIQILALTQAIVSGASRPASKKVETEEVQRPCNFVASAKQLWELLAEYCELWAGVGALAAAVAAFLLTATYHSFLLQEGALYKASIVLLQACGAFVLGALFKYALQLQWRGGESDQRCRCGRGCGCDSEDQCPYSQEFWSEE
eukprot:TRINITY_DN26646_c0_g1_i1.p1 TRINITY_DN26646_c0_g1~~TRINITY_DN26646_c0_g1_i1.p1  ORF type:complete len:182 (+),score=42.89 TRINITY_DN26646_c0_g1_i1:128-673(+)